MKKASIQNNRVVSYRVRQCGASLLEGIAYLGIAAIVILGAVSLLTSAFGSAQSNRAAEEIVSLRTAVKKLYSGQTYPTANMLSTLIAARAVPGSLVVSADKTGLTNAWGGAVAAAGDASGQSFTITYNSVPKDFCINMISGSDGWTKIKVGAAADIAGFPVSANAAATACTAEANTIVFTAS